MAETNTTFSIPCIKSCPIAQEAEVFVPNALYWRWVQLAKSYKEEWFAFLIGHDRTIDDMYIPRQIAGPAHCEPLPGEIRPGTIGAIHSHHTMGAFFSGTDWANMNGSIEVVINAAGDYEANCLIRLDCQRWGRVKAKIRLTGLESDMEALTQAIQKPAPVQSIYTSAPRGTRMDGSAYPSSNNPFDWHDVEDGEIALFQRKDYDIFRIHESVEGNPKLPESTKPLTKRQRCKLVKALAEKALVIP